MIIAMTISMSGGRHDDRPWPPMGTPFEVTDEEGEGLIRWGHAVRMSDTPVPVAPVMAHVPVQPERPARAGLGAGLMSLPAEAASPVPEPPLPSQQELDAAETGRAAVTAGPGYAEPGYAEPGYAEPGYAEPEPPKPADPKQAWMDYAVSRGITEDEAGAMTKADLMSRFGGRL